MTDPGVLLLTGESGLIYAAAKASAEAIAITATDHTARAEEMWHA